MEEMFIGALLTDGVYVLDFFIKFIVCSEFRCINLSLKKIIVCFSASKYYLNLNVIKLKRIIKSLIIKTFFANSLNTYTYINIFHTVTSTNIPN